jgi:hypothetical protein
MRDALVRKRRPKRKWVRTVKTDSTKPPPEGTNTVSRVGRPIMIAIVF